MTDQLPLEINVQETKQLLDAGEIELIDCREQDEYQLVNIEGATLFPMSQMQERAAEFDEMTDKRLVIHCHMGGRSMQVTQWLRQRGLSQVQSMAGGIDAWSIAIDTSKPRY